MRREVSQRLKQSDIRVDVDDRSERMNAKIRHAQLQKVPYMLVVGDKEAESDTASVRLRDGRDLGPTPIDATADLIREAIDARA